MHYVFKRNVVEIFCLVAMMLSLLVFSQPVIAINSTEVHLFYTIQTGSFIAIANARGQFNSVIQGLNKEKLDYLRIEKVGKFYSVRLGKFEDYVAANKFLRAIKQKLPSAIILKAYIKNERIFKLYPSDLVQEGDGDVLSKSRKMIAEGKYTDALSILAPYISEPMKYSSEVSDYIVILIWDGKPEKAIQMYENLPPPFPRKSYLLRNVAKAYYDKKEFQKALSLYEAALKNSPLDEETQKGIVFSLIHMGDFDRASEYLAEFLSKNPDSVSLVVSKAYLLFWKDEYTEAFNIYRMLVQRDDIDKEYIYKLRDDLIASLPLKKRKAMAAKLSESEEFIKEYLLVLILSKDFKSAISAFEASKLDIEQYSPHLISWIAWAYFKSGYTDRAKLYYKKVLSTVADYVRANIGLAYCLAKEGESKRALDILDNILANEPQNVEIMFARAYAFEQAKRFWFAVQEYERILKISRGNINARKLEIMALSDMGVSSYAFEKASKEFPGDLRFLDSIMGDMVMDRIDWEEYVDSIKMLKPRLQNKENLRARFDYIVALYKNKDMKEVIEVYEGLIKDGISPPPWVLENVAGAYLYLEQPYRALELYNKVLEIQPTFNSGIGRFYVLQEIREWEKAKKALNGLDRETPDVLRIGRKTKPNWPKADIKLARGWLLLYEDRLKEAQQEFWNLHKKAPANTNFRTGLSYSYLWQGWPRKALREFKISLTLDSKDINARIGKILALNTLSFKKQARDEARELLELYPKNKHVQALVHRLEQEEMRELFTDFVISGDDEGFEKIKALMRFTQPITLYTDTYGFLLWQRSSDKEHESFFRRIGIGVNHIFNSSLLLTQQFSVNYDNGENFGLYTRLDFTPDDYWLLSLSYDSFTTDIPMRARVFDIEADKLVSSLTYRESDWRSYTLSFSRLRFSDDNKRNQGGFSYEQGLYVRNNWKMRFFMDLYTSFNSLSDVPYFNPSNDFTLSATYLTEHTLMRLYRKAFVHRLYLTLGTYKQSGFSSRVIGSIRYEHDIDFSDVHSLLYGVSLSRQSFDGEIVTAYGFYLTWGLLF